MEPSYIAISGFVERLVLEGPYENAADIRSMLQQTFADAHVSELIANNDGALEVKRVAHKYAPLAMDSTDLLSVATYENLLLNITRHLTSGHGASGKDDATEASTNSDSVLEKERSTTYTDAVKKPRKVTASAQPSTANSRTKARAGRALRVHTPSMEIVEPDYNEVFKDL